METKKRRDSGSGSIRKRSNGTWEGRYSAGFDPRTGKQIQRSVYGKTQREVRQKLNELICELQEGISIEPTSLTVGQWLDIWLGQYKINLRPETHASYEQHIRVHLKPTLGKIRLNRLTPHQIQQTYAYLYQDQKLSAKTIKNIHGALHGALEQAKINGYLRTNPSDGAVLPKIERTPMQTMDKTDMVRFLEAIKGTEFEYPLFVAVFTGLRQGELLGLTWDCVDFQHGVLLINKQHNRAKGEKDFRFSELKNSKIRTLTVAEEVMHVLLLQKELQEKWAEKVGPLWDNAENLVFTTETGQFIHNKTLYAHFKKIVTAMGIPTLRFHDLRHAYSVNSLQAGDDIKTVQENLGHATAAFTLSTYAHATAGMKRESAQRMDRFIRTLRDTA